jgi:hypothetical protein
LLARGLLVLRLSYRSPNTQAYKLLKHIGRFPVCSERGFFAPYKRCIIWQDRQTRRR